MSSFALVDHLGWVLMHSLWQFGAIAFLAGLVVWMLRRSSSSARYGVWVFALGISVTAPVVTWMVLPIETPTVITVDPPAGDQIVIPAPIESMIAAPPLPQDITIAGDLPPASLEPRDPSLIAAAPSVEATPLASWSERLTSLLQPWMAWIVTGWCVGVTLCSLRPLLGWHTLWRLRTVGVAPVSDDMLATLRRVSDRLGLRQTVQVLQSTLSQVPVVVGYLRPVILLPVSLLTNMPPAQLEAILAHELAHIRRHDFVVNLLQTLVETLFFYHPAVWWLSRQIRVEREHCCDDLVVAALGNRVEYGRALLAIEELRGERTLLALGAHDGSLLSRIRRIVGFHADRTASSPWLGILMVTGLFGVIVSVGVSGWTASTEKDPDTAVETVDDDESDVEKTLEPPKPAIAEWADGRSIEFVGITKNTAPANDGWLPSGLPIGDVGYWKSTTVLHSGNTMATYVENGPHPEPDAEAIDFLFRFRSLKAQPSLTFDLPAHGTGYTHWPVTDPYELRVSTRKRGPQPPGGQWVPPDGVVRVGVTDEPWGRWVKVSPEGKVLDPIQPEERYASTYKLIEVVGTKKNERISTGVAILFRQPAGNKDPDNPDHQYAWEYRAIDEEGKEHWALQWESSNNESQYGLAQPLPAGKTLSHYEYRVRPYRHWVTFENVSLNPGPQTEVKVTARSLPAEPAHIRVLDSLGEPATFNTISMAHVGFPQKPMPKWVGWRNKHGLVPLEGLPFGTHWIVAAAEFEQRTIFPLTYPVDEKILEWRLRGSESWTQRDFDFKPRFEPDEKTGGDIVVTIQNKFDKPLKLSEADFSLHVGQTAMYCTMSPQWVDGKFQTVEIPAKESGEIRLSWNEWVRNGFWVSRDGETISEPALPPDEPGRIYVRVCLGNSGALPIAVTTPELILAEVAPVPFISMIVGEKRRFHSPMRIRQVHHFATRAATTFNEDPQTVIVTGQSAGFTVLSLENEQGEWYHAPIEVIEGKPPKYAERVPVTFPSKTAPCRTVATVPQETISVPMFRGVFHNLEFPDPIARVEGLDDNRIQWLPGGKHLNLLGLALGKSTFVVKTKHEDDETVQSWPVELQVNELSRDRLQEWMRDLKAEKPPRAPRLPDSSKSAAVVDEQLKAVANRFVEALKKRELPFLTEAHTRALFRELHEELAARVTQRQDRERLEQVFYAIDDHIGNAHLKAFATPEKFMTDFEILKTNLRMALDRDELTKDQQGQHDAQFAWYIEFAESFEKGKPARFVEILDENLGRRIKMRYDEFFLNQLRRMLNDPFNPYVAWSLTDEQFAEVQGKIRRPEWQVVKEPTLETITSIVFHAVAELQAKRVSQRWPIPNEMAVWDGFGRNRWRWDSVKANRTLASFVDKPEQKAEQPNDAAVNVKRSALLESLVTFVKVDRETGEPTPNRKQRSGVIIDDRGYILTVYYPEDSADDNLRIRLKDQSEHKAKVVAVDQKLSVALVQISSPNPLTAISLDHTPTVKEGERVAAIFHDGLPTVHPGKVTAMGEDLEITPTQVMNNVIKTDVVLTPHAGGSLMIRADNQPLGLWHAIRLGKERITFAIPLTEIAPFVTKHLPARQPPATSKKPAEAAANNEGALLLASLIKEPKLETFRKLLALAGGKHPTPTELLDDSRRHSGKEKMGGEVKVVGNGQERFAIVSAKVIPLIEPSDVAVRVDPERRAECAFVFDMQGRLIDTIGGKLSSGNSLGGDDIHVVNLGPEEDWFVRVMNFEKRGELNYRSDYYRIANPVVKSFRFYNLPNACSWSNGPEKIPRQGRLHPAHPQGQRPSFAGIPKQFPVTTTAGVPTVSTIVWDADRNRWFAAPSAFVKGLPLYEVDTTWSREFEPLEPQTGQLVIEGGIREFDHWSAWEAAVPDKGHAVAVLTIPQRNGLAKVIEKKLAPGRHTVQLQVKPDEKGPGVKLKLWIDDDQKYDFDLPFALGQEFANHPAVVNVLKPSESARLVHRLLKETTAALLFEIKLQPQDLAATATAISEKDPTPAAERQARAILRDRFHIRLDRTPGSDAAGSLHLFNLPTAAWEFVGQLTGIRQIRVEAGDARGEAMKQVSRIKSLESLSVINAKFLPADLKPLAKHPSLQTLDALFTTFDELGHDEGRTRLLGTLSDDERAWIEAATARWPHDPNQLQGYRRVVEGAAVTDPALEALTALPNLRTVRLMNTSVSDRGLTALQQLPQLEELHVHLVDGSPATGKWLAGFPKLRHLQETYAVGYDILPELAQSPTLEELSIRFAKDPQVDHIVLCRSVKRLNLSNNSLTDDGLLKLASMPQLERLVLSGNETKITQMGVKEFRELKPKCEIVGTEQLSEKPVPDTASTAGAQSSRGTLKGRFMFDGEAPEPRELRPDLSKLEKDAPVPRDPNGRPVGTAMWYMDYLRAGIRPTTADASLLVDKDGGIANIVVWVTSKDIPWTPKDNYELPAKIYVKEGRFTPRIRLLTTGRPLLIENTDPVSFTFATAFQRNNDVNALLPPAAEKKPFRIDKLQSEPLPAHFHSTVATWAEGFLVVRDNNYIAVSQPDGTFTMPDLPPGEWEFRAWHERRGYLAYWPKGMFQHTIQPGDNNLGTIKLKPEFFEPREER